MTKSEISQTISREELGRRVREIWLTWVKNSPSLTGKRPASWSANWNDLKEEDKEVDRLIGEGIQEYVLASGKYVRVKDVTRMIEERIENHVHIIETTFGDGQDAEEQHLRLTSKGYEAATILAEIKKLAGEKQ